MSSIATQSGTLSKSIHSGKWMVLDTIVQKILSLGTFFVLARLLTPADYGVIAVVLMITSLTDNLTNHGMELALAQRGGDMEPFLDAMWTINIIKALVLAAGLFLLGPVISWFFHIPEAVPLLRLSGLFIVLPKLGNARQIYFFTELNFKKIFWRDISSQIMYTVGAIGSVFIIGASYWALFIGHMARLLTAVIATYLLHPNWPRLSFRFKQFLFLFAYGKWIGGQNIVNYFTSFIDRLFIGRLLPVDMLGYYSKARDLSSVATASLSSIISKIGFFAYNNIQTKQTKIQDGFIRSLDLILFITLPVCFFLLVEGGAVVSTLLGDKWLSIVLPLKILSLVNIVNVCIGLLYPIFNSLGKPQITLKVMLVRLIASLPIFYIGIRFNELVGAAEAAGVVSLLVLLYAFQKSRAVLKLSLRTILLRFLHITGALLPVAIIAIILRPFIHSYQNDWLIFSWVIFLGIIYIGNIFWFGKSAKNGPRETLLMIGRELKFKKLIS